jgi:hypothetical protein
MITQSAIGPVFPAPKQTPLGAEIHQSLAIATFWPEIGNATQKWLATHPTFSKMARLESDA